LNLNTTAQNTAGNTRTYSREICWGPVSFGRQWHVVYKHTYEERSLYLSFVFTLASKLSVL